MRYKVEIEVAEDKWLFGKVKMSVLTIETAQTGDTIIKDIVNLLKNNGYTVLKEEQGW
jgi:hypothetical protein